MSIAGQRNICQLQKLFLYCLIGFNQCISPSHCFARTNVWANRHLVDHRSSLYKVNSVNLRNQSFCRLHASIESFDDDALTLSNTLIDIRMFLNQRCIQSFMFLLLKTRDPHTVKWLDDFTQSTAKIQDDYLGKSLVFGEKSSYIENDKILGSKLCQYHGLDGMNITKFPTWDSYFIQLLDQSSTTLKIKTHNNPHQPEFDIDIDPARICARILSVREQIANEWSRDLKIIEKMGYEKFFSYWENVKKGENGTDRSNLLFLDWVVDEESDFLPSPLRKGNFDLLLNIATQESVIRVLENGISVEGDDDGISSINYLRTYYLEKLSSHFVGMHRYGRADDFLDELMLSSPIMLNKDDKLVIVNPTTIAEIVLKTRDTVAREWMEIAKNSPDEHFEIRRLMLCKMMEK